MTWSQGPLLLSRHTCDLRASISIRRFSWYCTCLTCDAWRLKCETALHLALHQLLLVKLLQVLLLVVHQLLQLLLLARVPTQTFTLHHRRVEVRSHISLML